METVTRVGVSTLSLLLLGMGAAGLLGTYLIGFFVARRLSAVLIAAPLAMAVIALALVVFGRSLAATAVLLAWWGLIGTAAPVAWWTWLSRTLPNDAEAGGGLMVAAIQLAITAGASLGGLLFDRSGYQSTFVASAALLGGAALLALRASRALRTERSRRRRGPRSHAAERHPRRGVMAPSTVNARRKAHSHSRRSPQHGPAVPLETGTLRSAQPTSHPQGKP